MAHERGSNAKLLVGDGATPTETFTAIAGQRDLTFNMAQNTIDTSDKDTNGFNTYIYGLRDLSFTVSGIIDLPDTTGYERLRSAWLNGTIVNCEILLNSAGDKISGAFIVSGDSSFPNADASSYSFTLQCNGAPVYTAGS